MIRAILQADADLRGLAAAAGVSVAVDLDQSVRASLAADLGHRRGRG